jgi:hypothetical protein
MGNLKKEALFNMSSLPSSFKITLIKTSQNYLTKIGELFKKPYNIFL